MLRKGGMLSKVSGSRLAQTLAVIYHAACIKELKARGFTVEVVIDAWCELDNPEEIMTEYWGDVRPISLR